jgi:Cu-processing system permease protein
MNAVLSIAATTFKESIRNRTVLGILLLAIAFIASALLLAELSLDQRVRVMKDWGLFCVSLFGVLLAIIAGTNLVHKEVNKKTLYVVLTRPIRRFQYVLGKYLGLSLTLTLLVGALTAALLALLAFEHTAPDTILWMALGLSLIEILLLAALAVFFASFSSPYLSGFFTLGLFFVGRSIPTLDALASRVSIPAAKASLTGFLFFLPRLSDFAISTRAVHELTMPWSEFLTTAAYGGAYLALLLLFSGWIFSKRDMV